MVFKSPIRRVPFVFIKSVIESKTLKDLLESQQVFSSRLVHISRNAFDLTNLSLTLFNEVLDITNNILQPG